MGGGRQRESRMEEQGERGIRGGGEKLGEGKIERRREKRRGMEEWIRKYRGKGE